MNDEIKEKETFDTLPRLNFKLGKSSSRLLYLGNINVSQFNDEK